jgi:hypothetical protein
VSETPRDATSESDFPPGPSAEAETREGGVIIPQADEPAGDEGGEQSSEADTREGTIILDQAEEPTRESGVIVPQADDEPGSDRAESP